MSIIYLDTSALIKQYIREQGSDEVKGLIESAEFIGSNSMTLAEVASAFSRLVRMGRCTAQEGQTAWREFMTDWQSYSRLDVTSRLVERAADVAWQHGLRGYDAIHLASARFWQDAIGEPITFATYDRELWLAAQKSGILVWPQGLVP
jgi:predicted nucleic acid-binding protein